MAGRQAVAVRVEGNAKRTGCSTYRVEIIDVLLRTRHTRSRRRRPLGAGCGQTIAHCPLAGGYPFCPALVARSTAPIRSSQLASRRSGHCRSSGQRMGTVRRAAAGMAGHSAVPGSHGFVERPVIHRRHNGALPGRLRAARDQSGGISTRQSTAEKLTTSVCVVRRDWAFGAAALLSGIAVADGFHIATLSSTGRDLVRCNSRPMAQPATDIAQGSLGTQLGLLLWVFLKPS